MSIFSRIKSALSKTSNSLVKATELITKKGIEYSTIEELEEALLTADFGIDATNLIIEKLKKIRISKQEGQESFKDHLISIIEEILQDIPKPIELLDNKLNVILFCGVNGNGKTTTIGKLANKYIKEGKKVVVAACDTFRSAAVEQLKVWSEKIGAEIVYGAENADPASIAFQALTVAKDNNKDILIIDTAGRLQNKHNLMEELSKVIKVLKKFDETYPTHVILTLDSTTGQNANSQVEKFIEYAGVTGIIFTKLDGTAKGGAIVGISMKYSLPIFYITLGENMDDIIEFDSKNFAKALLE
jgi:fused signal recognition particle receptor